MIINGNLDLSGSSITSLGDIKKVNGTLDLEETNNLFFLPENLEVENLYLSFSSIRSLPKGLKIRGFLSLNYCENISSIPSDIKVEKSINLLGSRITAEYILKNNKELFEKCRWLIHWDK